MTALPSTNFLRSKGWSFAKARFVAARPAYVFLVLAPAPAMSEVQLGQDISKLPPAVQRMRQAVPLNALTPSQEAFLTPARVEEMIAQGKYRFYGVGIGRDGVWHYFSSE